MERLINMEQNYKIRNINNINNSTLESFNQHKKVLIEEQKLQKCISIIKQEIPFKNMKNNNLVIQMELNIIDSSYGEDVAEAVVRYLKLDEFLYIYTLN